MSTKSEDTLSSGKSFDVIAEEMARDLSTFGKRTFGEVAEELRTLRSIADQLIVMRGANGEAYTDASMQAEKLLDKWVSEFTSDHQEEPK